jgi:hypothetical protein
MNLNAKWGAQNVRMNKKSEKNETWTDENQN